MSESATLARTNPTNSAAPHWPDEVRESAFELYFLRAGRDLPTVAAMLNTEEFGNHSVPDRTLRYWRSQDQWDMLADARLAALAPNMADRTDGALMVAAYHAAQSMLRMTSGEEPPDRFRIMANVAALNAAGYGSSNRRDTASRRPLPADTEDAASSPEDAARRIAERRARFGSKV